MTNTKYACVLACDAFDTNTVVWIEKTNETCCAEHVDFDANQTTSRRMMYASAQNAGNIFMAHTVEHRNYFCTRADRQIEKIIEETRLLTLQRNQLNAEKNICFESQGKELCSACVFSYFACVRLDVFNLP